MDELIELLKYLKEKSDGDRVYFDALYTTDDETLRQAIDRLSAKFAK